MWQSSRSKCCSYQAFANHKQCRMRVACGTPLLKSVELASQRKILYPFITYCYFSIKCSLQSLLLVPGLALACEQWWSRCITEGVMEDVYDGNIWKEFQVYDDRPFPSNPSPFGVHTHTLYAMNLILPSYSLLKGYIPTKWTTRAKTVVR